MPAAAFVILLAVSWQKWANLTIDGGREMNTPLRLLGGERIYADVYYLYGPLAPYVNAALYAVFGIHLNTLYGAGIVASILLLLLIFELGKHLTGVWEAALTTWMVVVFCVLKQDGNYIFPYTYSAVYGTILGVSAVAAQVRYVRCRHSRLLTLAGVFTGLALICKMEFGFAATMSALALAASERPGGRMRVLVRGLWPALTICLLTWAVLLSRVPWDSVVKDTFLWPFDIPSEIVYYNKAKLGLNDPAKTLRELLSAVAMLGLAAIAVIVASASQAAKAVGAGLRTLPRPWLRRILFIAGASAAALVVNLSIYKTRWDVSPFRALPVLCLGAIYGYASRTRSIQEADPQSRSLFVLSVYGLAVLGRVILRVPSGGAYGAYLLPVPLLVFTHLATRFYSPALGTFPVFERRARQIVVALFVMALTAATGVIAYRYGTGNYVALHTARGTARLPASESAAFAGALDFIARHTHQGEYVAALPEGSSLNFLADRPAPLRYEILTPGFLTAAGEQHAIAQLTAKRVALILLLNRPTREFGCPAFGRDCYRILGGWIDANYEPIAAFGERANARSQIGDPRFFIKALGSPRFPLRIERRQRSESFTSVSERRKLQSNSLQGMAVHAFHDVVPLLIQGMGIHGAENRPGDRGH
jgi:hypothetical protein